MVVAKEISARELVETSLRRIDALDDQLHAFITVDHEGALKAADAADRAVQAARDPAAELGPLHGAPISVKDLELTKGLRTTLGCKLYEGWAPEFDSIVVERLRKAGAVIVGKTNTPEFGNAAETYNKVSPSTNNPWDPGRTPGGSSGGAAASVAAAMVSISTGSDGGGSVRIPCAFTGLYGIKATQGRIPRFGGVSRPATNLTSSTGPMTRTVRDTAILLEVLSGHDSRDPSSLRASVPSFTNALDDGVRGMRIGYSSGLGFSRVEPEIETALMNTVGILTELGATVEEAPLVLDPPPFSYWWVVWTGAQKAMYGHLVESHIEDLMHYTVAMSYHGAQLTAADYAKALREAEVLRAQLGDYFETYDLLLLPTTAITAFPHRNPPSMIAGEPVLTAAGIPYGAFPTTAGFNISWNPAASIPAGFDSQGLPIGLQLVGDLQDEEAVLRASAALEEARPWAERLPPVS